MTTGPHCFGATNMALRNHLIHGLGGSSIPPGLHQKKASAMEPFVQGMPKITKEESLANLL